VRSSCCVTPGLPTPERYLAWFALASEDVKAELAAHEAEPAARVFDDLFRAAPPGLSRLGRLQFVDLKTMLLQGSAREG